MFAPIGLPPPATPRLNELMSCSLLNRNCAPTGLTPARGAGEPPGGGSVPATSVARSVPAGGGAKSLKLLLHLPPPWHVWQPALKNRTRPWLIVVWSSPPVLLPPSSAVVSGRLGVRILKRAHSFIASSAGQ